MSDQGSHSDEAARIPEAADPRFTAFMDHSPAVAWIKDHEFRYRYINRAYEELFRLSAGEVIGKEDYDLMPAEVADQTRGNDAAVLESGKASEVVELVPGADGVVRHWLVKKFPFEGEEGRLWTGGMAFEITSRVEAQQQLKDSEALYASLVNSIPMNVFRKDLEGRITFMSPRYMEELGETPGSILGKTDFDLFPEELAEKYRNDDRRVVEREATIELVEEFENAEGDRSFVQTLKTPVRDADGRVVGMQGIFWDITEKKMAEERLAQRERELREIIDVVPHAIFMKDSEGRFLLANKATAEAYGMAPEEIVGKLHQDVDRRPDLVETMLADDREVIETRRLKFVPEEVLYDSTGSRRILQTTKIPFEIPGGRMAVLGVAIDITRQHEADEELRQAHQRQDLHVQRTPLGVIEWDLDFCVAEWNPAAESIFGYSREEVMGSHASFIIPEEARAHVDEIWANLLAAEGGLRSSNVNLHKSGRTIHCEWHNTPLVTASGKVIGVTSLVQDVTGLKQAEAEKERMQKKLQETQKLESLGILAGGIAHDFNNLLTGILGNASLARMRLPDSSPGMRFVQQIEEAATRAADLCSQMLAYSGKGRFVVRKIDLNSLIRDTTHLLELSISKKASLRFELQERLPATMADATQMRQIIMNLVINASEALGEKQGEITLKTGIQKVDARFLKLGHFDDDFREGDYLTLEVSDTGCGMDEATREKIFDPFFTTKFTGRGLGLAAALGIVRGHGGGVHVYSEPDVGTTFKLFLPFAEGEAETFAAAGPAPSTATAQGGLVLIVDDEDTVRAVTEEMLLMFGFKVASAVDGEEGVRRFREQGDRVSLVLLDLTMPNMDGEEAFREIRRLRNEVPVLLMSGFNEQEAINRFAGLGLAGFIQKPFKAEELRGKIDEALANAE